jgi:Holliday junction DNA helicase RuvA
MIASLSGSLLSKKPGHIIIDVNGVGYEAMISNRTYDQLPLEGEDLFLFIQTNVREDAITLFGFSEIREKELFLLLNTVSGVGPKLAIAILSGLSVPELCQAISMKDIGILTTLSGVGKKTAQRLCVELSDKISTTMDFTPAENHDRDLHAATDTHAVHDSISALINLGYPQHTAWQALKTVQKSLGKNVGDMKVEELIREALKVLA